MTVATEDDFRPFEFTEDGKPTGYDQELLEMFKNKAGIRDPPGHHPVDRHSAWRHHRQI